MTILGAVGAGIAADKSQQAQAEQAYPACAGTAEANYRSRVSKYGY